MNALERRTSVAPKEPKPRIIALVLLILVCGLALVLVLPRMKYRRTNFFTCFQSATGLYPGAKVRVAGVDVGVVRTVTAGDRECTIKVEMTARMPVTSEISVDGVAQLGTDDKGAPVVEIDIRGASSRPVLENGILKSRGPDAAQH